MIAFAAVTSKDSTAYYIYLRLIIDSFYLNGHFILVYSIDDLKWLLTLIWHVLAVVKIYEMDIYLANDIMIL